MLFKRSLKLLISSGLKGLTRSLKKNLLSNLSFFSSDSFYPPIEKMI